MEDMIIRNNPNNILNDNPEDLDKYSLDEAVKLIRAAGILLKCSIVTRMKSLLIYHNFKRCVHETNYDPYMVAAACVNLSTKYNEEPVEFDTIILLFFRILDQKSRRSTLSQEFKDIQKSLTWMECLIMRMLEFHLDHTVAHQYLTYFLNDLQDELSAQNLWDVFSETSLKLACDFYLSNKCLIYKADEIAIAVIHATLYLLGVDIQKTFGYTTRLKALHNCPNDKLSNIIQDIVVISHIGPCAENMYHSISK